MKVKFLIDKENQGNIGECVYAFFPEEKYDYRPDTFTCYAHVGQHSACSIGYVKECREATINEFWPLLRELSGIYNDLEVINSQKITYKRKPTPEEIKMGYGAIHYLDFPLSECIKNGRFKQWILKDGLRYYY